MPTRGNQWYARIQAQRHMQARQISKFFIWRGGWCLKGLIFVITQRRTHMILIKSKGVEFGGQTNTSCTSSYVVHEGLTGGHFVPGCSSEPSSSTYHLTRRLHECPWRRLWHQRLPLWVAMVTAALRCASGVFCGGMQSGIINMHMQGNWNWDLIAFVGVWSWEWLNTTEAQKK